MVQDQNLSSDFGFHLGLIKRQFWLGFSSISFIVRLLQSINIYRRISGIEQEQNLHFGCKYKSAKIHFLERSFQKPQSIDTKMAILQFYEWNSQLIFTE